MVLNKLKLLAASSLPSRVLAKCLLREFECEDYVYISPLFHGKPEYTPSSFIIIYLGMILEDDGHNLFFDPKHTKKRLYEQHVKFFLVPMWL